MWKSKYQSDTSVPVGVPAVSVDKKDIDQDQVGDQASLVHAEKTSIQELKIPGASASIIGVNALGTQPLPPTTKLRLKGSLRSFALRCIAPDTATTS